nr:PadR family transcriptional regulator [Propionicimonas sp.]
MDTSRTLLGLLEVEPNYGYELKQSYDRFFGGARPVAFGQVYATLARMARHGLIAALGSEAGGGPDRKRYVVTQPGRIALREWMSSPDDPEATVQSNLFAKTVIALLIGEDAQGLLDAQRSEHIGRMRALTREKQGAALARVLTIDHVLFHIEADLRWIDLTAARLTELRREVASR